MEIRKTPIYSKWIDSLRDLRARARIQTRIERLEAGNPGQVAAVGQGVSELKIDYGPGYMVYYIERKHTLILLLLGGDKSTQQADIATALDLEKKFQEH